MTDNEREFYRQGFIDGYKLGYEQGKENFLEKTPASVNRCLKCGRDTMNMSFYDCIIVDCPNKVSYLSIDNTAQFTLLNEDNMNKGTTT